MNKEKILDALKTIQRVCENHTCDVCPFGDDNATCLISMYSPVVWDFNEAEVPWRAFRN